MNLPSPLTKSKKIPSPRGRENWQSKLPTPPFPTTTTTALSKVLPKKPRRTRGFTLAETNSRNVHVVFSLQQTHYLPLFPPVIASVTGVATPAGAGVLLLVAGAERLCAMWL